MKTKAEGRVRTVLSCLTLVLMLSLSGLAQVTVTKPIKAKAPKIPTEKYKGVVINWTPVSVTVHSPGDFNRVRSFTFSEPLQKKVQDRYLENGDPITLYVLQHSDLVVKISGKLRHRDKGLKVFKQKNQ